MTDSLDTADLTGPPTQSGCPETRRLIVVTSGKGGTGTSVYSRVLLDCYADRNRDIIAVDTSDARSTFHAYLRDEETCKYCDLSKASAFDILVDLCRDHELVLLDLASGAYNRFEHWLTDSGFAREAQARGIRLTVFFMVNREPETTAIISRGMKALEKIAEIVAVNNLGNTGCFPTDDLDAVSMSTLPRETTVINLPKLDRSVITALTKSRIRFRDAVPDGCRCEELSILDRHRVKIYLDAAKSQLACVGKYLS